MDEIIRWIVSVLAVIIAAFILIIKKQGSGGKTSQEVKDRLEDLNKQIEQKKKEVGKLAKETEEIYKKNDEKISAPIPPVDNVIGTANELWNKRKQ